MDLVINQTCLHGAERTPFYHQGLGMRTRQDGRPFQTGSTNRTPSLLFHPVGYEEERAQLTNMPSLFSLLG